MDALDVGILREMGVQPYGARPRPPDTLKAASVAKRLNVNPERVADRLARLAEDGILLGYEVYPNYRHLNLEVACYHLRFGDDDQAARVLDEAAHVDGVASVYTFVGGEANASVCGASPAELDRKIDVLARLAGGGAWRKLYGLVTPPVRRPLDLLDWRILQALRGNAWRPNAEVGAVVGVSGKTVARRLERMAEEGAFFVIPELEMSKMEGVLLTQLWLSASGPDALASLPRAAREAFHDVLLTHDEFKGGEGAMEAQLAVAARSMHDVARLTARARELPGVTSARALVLRDGRESYAWVDEAIAARIRVAAPST